jgi:hypothetical protein
MKKYILIILLLLTPNEIFSQKLSLGVLAGYTMNFEFTKSNSSYLSITTEKSIDTKPRVSFGIYSEYKIGKKLSAGLQIKNIRVIQTSNQDTEGNPIFSHINAVYETINFSHYYTYDMKAHWRFSLGAYYNLKAFYGMDLITIPSTNNYGGKLKVNNNVFGSLLKGEYKWRKLSLEGGFMYPFTSTSQSYSTRFYVPTAFLQLKYNFLR